MTPRDWFEDDQFWDTLEPFFFSLFRTPEKTTRETDLLLDLLEIERSSRVLDFCCGPGRFAIELANRGFRVTGVDRTARYLHEARARAQEHGVDIELIEEDVRHFCRPEYFDLTINMLTSFGYFDRADDDRRMLQNACESLRAGGRLVMDLMGKECLARDFRPRDWHRHPVTGHYLLEERLIRDDWEVIETRWIVLLPDGRREFTSRLRLYSGRELADLLRAVGFTEVDLYGGLDGAPYDDAAERLVAVALR